MPIYYYRCPACRFLFTTAFDDFSKEDFRRYVYNDEYLLVDPDYRKSAPGEMPAMLCSLFAAAGRGASSTTGAATVPWRNSSAPPVFPMSRPMTPSSPVIRHRPAGRFDCVVSFEVVEHSTDPERTFADMSDFLTEPGLIVFSTLLQPADIDRQGLNWWYAGPRNGHVSLFSRESLGALIESIGFGFASFNDNLHVAFREIPDFARHFLIPLDQYATEGMYTSMVMAC